MHTCPPGPRCELPPGAASLPLGVGVCVGVRPPMFPSFHARAAQPPGGPPATVCPPRKSSYMTVEENGPRTAAWPDNTLPCGGT